MISEDECLKIGRAVVDVMSLRRDSDFRGEIPLYLEYWDAKNSIAFRHWKTNDIVFEITGLRGSTEADLTVSFVNSSNKPR